jgi:cyanophycinase-like exopeptidase
MAKEIRGLAVDERNAVLLDEHGRGTLVGQGAAYFMHPMHPPEMCKAGTPLTIRNIAVYKITKTGSFDFSKWQGSGGVEYELSVENGAVKSTKAGGSPY